MSYDPISKWEEFIRSRYWDDLLKLAESYPSTRSLIVNFADLDRYDTEFADDLLENPDVMLDAAHTALQEIVLPVDVDLSGAHVRVVNLPQHLKTRDLRSDHIGKLIAIEGQVRTATEVRPKIVRAAYECQRCGHVFYVEQSGTKFTEPYECPNEACDRRGPFRLLPKRSQFVDAQKVRVQESPEDLRGGEQPQTLDVELGDDLVGRIFPGDRVIINGILRSYQRTTQSGKSTYFDLFLDGISIEMMEQEFEEIEISPEDEKRILELSRDPDIYGKIVRSIAPSIYGYEDVKEALALQLVSGFSKRLPDGARIRGDIHILLVGDPGVAKSQLLRYMAKLSPRGIYTSGKSSTSAGLTATAIKDELGDGRWTIEAGALVLADKGIAAVDEMDKMSPDDRSALHEAMEQQSYHPLTEIQLSDGRKVRIGEFVDSLMKSRHDEIIRGVDCEMLPLNGDIKVWSTDLSRIFELPVDRVSRHRAPDHFIKIKYSNGREIIVTPEHPVYIARDGIACIPACEVTKGSFVPAPRSIQCSTDEPELREVERQHPGEKPLIFPKRLNPVLSKILGYLTTKGHFYKGSSHEIGFSNKDVKLLDDMSHLMEDAFGIKASRNERADGVVTLRFISSQLVRWFEANFPELMRTGRNRRAPAIIFKGTENCIQDYLIAAFLGDGCVHSTSIAYSTVSRGLAEDYQDLLLKLGVSSRIVEDRKAKAFKVCIMGDSHSKFEGLFSSSDHEKLLRMRRITSSCNRSLRHHDVLPTETALKILEAKKALGLVNDGYFNEHINCGYGLNIDTVTNYLQELRHRYDEVMAVVGNETKKVSLSEMRSALGWSQNYLASIIGTTRGSIDYYERGGYSEARREEIAEYARQQIQAHLEYIDARISAIGRILSSDIRYLKVVEVEVIPNEGEYSADYVYDLTVEPTHTFISHGLVLHNTISVAKAGVMATLKSRCALLAAANPKMGRFDKYEPIAPQINLTPALMSRFDLIFVLTDEPNAERDAHIATHILRSNYAGELSSQRSINPSINDEDIESATEIIKPEIEPELLRKYVAYARKNIFPTLTEVAMERFKEYYINLRSQGQDGNKPVPVTARQLEALIRLGEASARLRLSNRITEEDVDRVIRIVESCLKKVGVDPETGMLDADVISIGISKSTRDKTKLMLNIVRELGGKEGAQIDDVLDRAEAEGIDRERAEEIISRLRQEGSLIQTSRGTLRAV
ncbi:MAG: LAGLIDADG family homing endonuclease [Methanothrix sp.]|uniref:LAGLIDADG family homing endonuclease n=1 Tax=Methanothrix sp. TaxID=90426 RepID=UPI0032AF5260|nr:LAGLIDADG family homing endonuclease [Methanothrix sp.]